MTTRKPMTTPYFPRIYVACLASYNAGTIYGRWIDATQSPDDLRADIADMLAASPTPGAEEWAIHGTDNFDGIGIGENDSMETVAFHAEMLERHGAAWAAYVEDVGAHYVSPDDGDADFKDRYCGEWDSERAFAENLADDMGLLADANETLVRYFDYDAFARDLFIDDYTMTDGHVFARS